jgi:hypothetical protein
MHERDVRELGTDELDLETVLELPDRQALTVITPMGPLCRGLALVDALTGGSGDDVAAVVDEPADGGSVIAESSSEDGSGVAHGLVVAAAVNHGGHATAVASVNQGDGAVTSRHIAWPCSPLYAQPHHGPVA